VPTVTYTDLSPLLLRLATRLVERNVIGPSSVLVTAKRPKDVPHLVGEKDILLRVGPEANVGTDEGGGEYDTRSRCVFQLVCRTRCELDEAESDRLRLTDSSLGHLVFRGKARKAVQLFWPDVTQDLDTVEPLHWLRTSDPEPDARDPNWLSSVVEFEAVYPADMDRPTP
jgi:hypothetical protein